MTPDQLRELESSLSTDEGQQQAYAIAQELLQKWDGQPNTAGRVVGFGARGDDVRAIQLITRAAAIRDGVEDARDALTVDGIFGSDTRAAVGLGQNAVGEREDYIAGKYYALSHVHAMAGLQPPEGGSFSARRRAIRDAMREQPDRFAQAAPLPAELAAPGQEPAVAGPTEVTDAQTAAAAVVEASALTGDARAPAFRRIGDAVRAHPQAAEGVIASLTAQGSTVETIVDYLRANEGQDNDAVIRGLRPSQQWESLRSVAGRPGFDVSGLSSRTLDAIAGEQPAATAAASATNLWRALRLRAVTAKAGEGVALDRRDFDTLVAANDPATIGLLTRGPRDQAVAALRAAIDRLSPQDAAALLRRVHGELPPNPSAATDDTRARWGLTHAVLNDVFGAEGVGPASPRSGTASQRYRFFRDGVAAEGQPFFTTMDDGTYAALRDKIWATGSDWSWLYGGARSVGHQLDRFDAERQAWRGAAASPT